MLENVQELHDEVKSRVDNKSLLMVKSRTVFYTQSP